MRGKDGRWVGSNGSTKTKAFDSLLTVLCRLPISVKLISARFLTTGPLDLSPVNSHGDCDGWGNVKDHEFQCKSVSITSSKC